MGRADTPICGICQCRFGDGDCVHFSDRRGSDADPYVPDVQIHPNSKNLVEKGPAGLGAFLPPYFLDPPAVHVYLTVDYPIAYDAAQGLFFHNKRYDSDSMHDEEKFPSRLTCKTPGLFEVSFNVRWSKTNDSTATGDLATFIRKDGSQILGIKSMPVPGPDSFGKQSNTIEVPLRAGEYLEAMVKQDVRVDADEGDETEPKVMYVTAERQSPIFCAVFLRPIEAMDILGVPESV